MQMVIIMGTMAIRIMFIMPDIGNAKITMLWRTHGSVRADHIWFAISVTMRIRENSDDTKKEDEK